MSEKLYRGMKPWREEAIKLKFGAYIDRAKLPTVPTIFGHVGRAQPPIRTGWAMLGNDQAGDCVIAGGCHEIMTWAWATRRSIPKFTTASVLSQYYALSGGKDTGLDPIDTAKWRCKKGIADADGHLHAIKAFASVNSLEEIELAVYLFGACGVGLELPDNAEDAFNANKPWNDTSGAAKPENGHYVPIVGKNSVGNLIVVTWGRLQAVSKEYIDKYCSGGVCYFSREYLRTGVSPELFSEAQLDSDMASLGTVQTA